MAGTGRHQRSPRWSGSSAAGRTSCSRRRRSLVEAKRRSTPRRTSRRTASITRISRGTRSAHAGRTRAGGVDGPVLGVIGLIDERVDMPLLAHGRRTGTRSGRSPSSGRTHGDPARLARRANVRLLGRQPYARLPAFCRGWPSGLVPFVVERVHARHQPDEAARVSQRRPPGGVDGAAGGGEVRRILPCGPGRRGIRGRDRGRASWDTAALRLSRSTAVRAESWETSVAALGRHLARLRARDRGHAC